MKAGPIEIGRLLQQRARFCVPIYQRHYVWKRDKQWQPLWEDIRTKAVERLTGRDRRFSHYMGAVVTEQRGGYSARHVPAYQVVDGQQRLTTFTLFLTAARHYALSIGYETAAGALKTYTANSDTHLMENPELEVFKVWPTQHDRDVFCDVLTLDRSALRSKYSQFFYVNKDLIYPWNPTPTVMQAYSFFYEEIKKAVEDGHLAEEVAPSTANGDAASADLPKEILFDAVWRALVEEFKVVEIVLEDGDDAQVIFETLNERGEPLLAADLVRNNIFHRADEKRENPEALFQTHWNSFEDEFWEVPEKQGRYKKPRIEFFLANHIAGQIASEVNLSKLFSEYKAFVKARQFGSVAEEIKSLATAGSIYRHLIERQPSSALGSFASRLAPWDVTTVFPLVMRIWGSSLGQQDKIEAIGFLISYVVRRSVCGLTTRNYNKFFLSVIADLEKGGWTNANLISFLMKSGSETTRWPRDDEFERHWLNSPLYSILQPMRARALLEEIERTKRTKYHETQELADGLTVEHIMPSNWRDSWPLSDGALATPEEWMAGSSGALEEAGRVGQVAARNRIKHTIGNLTLLTQPLNSSISNGPFVGKRDSLQQNSLLVLNREVTQNEAWNEESILARGKALFDVARTLWPIPTSTV